MVHEVFEAEGKPKFTIELDDLIKIMLVLRLSIGPEPHDFVLIAVFPKAQVLSQRRVVDAQRMRERN